MATRRHALQERNQQAIENENEENRAPAKHGLSNITTRQSLRSQSLLNNASSNSTCNVTVASKTTVLEKRLSVKRNALADINAPTSASKRRKTRHDTSCVSALSKCSLEEPIEMKEIEKKPTPVKKSSKSGFQLPYQLGHSEWMHYDKSCLCEREKRVIMEILQCDYAVKHSMDPAECLDYLFSNIYYEQDRDFMDLFKLERFIELNFHPSISKEDLACVVDWMGSMQQELEINLETFHLSVGLLYAYLSRCRNLNRSDVLISACTAIWIATKFEERECAPLRHFANLLRKFFPTFVSNATILRLNSDSSSPSRSSSQSSNFASTSDEEQHAAQGRTTQLVQKLVACETKMLLTLRMAINRPNAYLLIRRYGRVLDMESPEIQFVARFLIEITLMNYDLMLAGESLRSAVCLLLGRGLFLIENDNMRMKKQIINGKPLWPPALQLFSRTQIQDLVPLLTPVHETTLKWLRKYAVLQKRTMDRFLSDSDSSSNKSNDSTALECFTFSIIHKYSSDVFLNIAQVYCNRLAQYFPCLIQLLSVDE